MSKQWLPFNIGLAYRQANACFEWHVCIELGMSRAAAFAHSYCVALIQHHRWTHVS